MQSLVPLATPSSFIGVDVAKAELVIAKHDPGLAAGPTVAVPNTGDAIAVWLAGLPAASRIAMESTGRYHGLLAKLALQAGHVVYVLNARDVYYYAQALGTRGKTDRLDAHVIARYIAEHHASLHPWCPPNPVQLHIDKLLAHRALLGKQEATLRLSLKDLGIDAITVGVGKLMAEFEALMARIDKEVQALVASDAQLAQGCANLRTITGIGVQISPLLASLFSRIAFANADALVAFCGLDPRPRDSGTLRGRRHLSKRGPALLRRQIWLAGFAATKSKLFGPIYKALRARGIPSTAAIVILGRRLLRIAFAVWRSGKPFDPSKIGPASPKIT
jgi:transposase